MNEQMNVEEETKRQTGLSFGDASACMFAGSSVCSHVEPTQSTTLPVDENLSVSRLGGATGPRTGRGKEKTKRNAIKHGIFSKVVLLKSESRTEFDGLSRELRKSLQPEGTLETVFVDKLAVLLWRYRRLVTAETAEIQKGLESVSWEEHRRQSERTYDRAEYSDYALYGVISEIEAPKFLDECLRLLMILTVSVMDNGFRPDFDISILTKLYGEANFQRMRTSLFDSYRILSKESQCSEAERQRNDCSSPEECRLDFIEEAREEIRKLKIFKRKYRKMESERISLEGLRANIPEAPELDRLLRYEASIERSIDRTLSQLERLQRMRLGQPVLPKLEVQHSLS